MKILKNVQGNVLEIQNLEEIGEQPLLYLGAGDYVYIDVMNPTENELRMLQNRFGFHHLSVEDCIKRDNRPKVDIYDTHYFVTITDVADGSANQLIFSNLYCFFGKQFLVTVKYDNFKQTEDVVKKLMHDNNFAQKGVDYIFYYLFDYTAEHHFALMDILEDRIDALQSKALRHPDRNTVHELLNFKKKVAALRRMILPQREILNVLLRRHLDCIKEDNRAYFENIYEHLIRIYEMIESLQDMAGSCMELYSSQLSNATNDKMKILTIISTFFMPLTFLTSLYGMNFQFMPELKTHYGYPCLLLVLAVITIGQFTFLKKKKWL